MSAVRCFPAAREARVVLGYDGDSGGIARGRNSRESRPEASTSQPFAAVARRGYCGVIPSARVADGRPSQSSARRSRISFSSPAAYRAHAQTVRKAGTPREKHGRNSAVMNGFRRRKEKGEWANLHGRCGELGEGTQSSHVGTKHEREESNHVRQFWGLAALPGAHSYRAKSAAPAPATPASLLQ